MLLTQVRLCAMKKVMNDPCSLTATAHPLPAADEPQRLTLTIGQLMGLMPMMNAITTMMPIDPVPICETVVPLQTMCARFHGKDWLSSFELNTPSDTLPFLDRCGMPEKHRIATRGDT